MLELIVAVCLIEDSSRCKDVHLTMLEGRASPFECMMYGQVEISKWIEANPKWHLQRWSCAPAGQFANL